jgi:hypothetical protein
VLEKSKNDEICGVYRKHREINYAWLAQET